MREADILESTYFDTLRVYRAYKVIVDGEITFKKRLDGKLVYKDIPCSLSSHSGKKAYKKQRVVEINSDYKLFTRPEVDIEENDTLLVNHLNKEYLLTAGIASRFISHNEVPCFLQREKAWVSMNLKDLIS